MSKKQHDISFHLSFVLPFFFIDYKIDERLCAAPPGSGQLQLLASKPSEDGELWVCYLEKALAIHCGGWDKITGGQCTHAWSLLTGCKEQYTIRMNPATGKYACYAKYNPNILKWAPHANSPHDCEKTMWRVAWPKVGGGGDLDKELTADELFIKMVAWDEENYIVGAGTGGSSDKNRADGMVDNHGKYRLLYCSLAEVSCVVLPLTHEFNVDNQPIPLSAPTATWRVQRFACSKSGEYRAICFAVGIFSYQV